MLQPNRRKRSRFLNHLILVLVGIHYLLMLKLNFRVISGVSRESPCRRHFTHHNFINVLQILPSLFLGPTVKQSYLIGWVCSCRF